MKKSGEIACFDNCASCGVTTEYACADCKIDTGISVHVCGKVECREKHEQSGNCTGPRHEPN